MKARWHPQAVADVKSAMIYGRNHWPKSAREIAGDILRVVDRLREFPLSGRLGAAAGTREVVMIGYPFPIIYQVENDTLTVLRVLHEAQRWKGGDE